MCLEEFNVQNTRNREVAREVRCWKVGTLWLQVK